MNENNVALAACNAVKPSHFELTSTPTYLQQHLHKFYGNLLAGRNVVTDMDHTKLEYPRNDLIEVIEACTVITKQCVLK